MPVEYPALEPLQGDEGTALTILPAVEVMAAELEPELDFLEARLGITLPQSTESWTAVELELMQSADMSAARNLRSEEQFLCSICLDVFTNPVTTSCGHNFCKNCIEKNWNNSRTFRCPNCNEIFLSRPELRINTFISEMVSQFRREAQQKSSSSSSEQHAAKPGEVPCDICAGTKLKALKSCLVCLISYCETHLEPHITLKRLKGHQLIEPVENLDGRICLTHDKPLGLFCKTDQTCVCLNCTYSDHSTHEFVPLTEECEEKKTELGKAKGEIQQMIQKKQLKIEEIKELVKKSKNAADREKAEGVQVFTALKESVESHLNKLIKEIEDKQKTTEKQAEDSIKDLEQEISELVKRNSKVEQLLKSEDHLHVLQSFSSLKAAPSTKGWTEVRVRQPSYEGTVMRAVAQLEEMISEQMKKFELKWVQKYEVDVTLDPNTAHPELIVSDDGKQVYDSDVRKELPDNPERFSKSGCILGKQSFSSGRFYFEVQVKGKSEWGLGVVRESVNRKEDIDLSPQNDFWSVFLMNGNEYIAGDDPPVHLSFWPGPKKVGVFVDYDGGLVSFYNVDVPALIYSFTGCSFNDKLHLFFHPGENDGGINVEPLSSDMSSARKYRSEDKFLCAICLDVFTDPVTTPCGPNFCKNCINQLWNQSVLYKCPICNDNFGTKPQLKINRLLSEMASEFRFEAEQKSSSEQQAAKPGEVSCDSCTGTKLKAMKSFLVCLVSFCEMHLEPHLTMKALKVHQLIDPMENLEDRMCSKHHKPLDMFCKTDQTFVCFHCTYSDHRYHYVVPLTEECKGKKADLEKTEAKIKQMIQKRRLNTEEIKESVKKSEEAADREKAEGVQVFTALKQSVERCLNKLIKEIENKQKITEKQAEESIKALEQEISELMKRSSEVEQPLKSEDHLHLPQSFSSLKAALPTKCWTEVRVHPPSYEKRLVTAMDQLEETIRKQLKKFELKWVQRYEVDVTLDPDTAHPRLIVSDDGKQLFDGIVEQDVPDDQGRFTNLVSVSGKQRFSSRRFYFEVQVKVKTEWTLGVVRELINKYGNIRLRPDTGFWTLCLINGNEYGASEDLPGFFFHVQFVQRSDCPFNEKIYPYFSLWYNNDAKTSEPLIITPVSHTD
ncbi:uncharacterized protein KZ484_011866 [Pholidichthys leucotaenia]